MSYPMLFVIVILFFIVICVSESKLAKLDHWGWGAIIPGIIVILAGIVFLTKMIPFNWKSFLLFMVPLAWTLEEWDKGRKKRKLMQEKEIELMKAIDLE